MKILFVHQNFPGQYLHLARYLGAQGHEVAFITQRKNVDIPGVRKILYKPRRTITPQTHHYLRESEAAVLNAQEVLRCAVALKNSGFVPEVMLGHNGWGEIWYLKDVFPRTPLIGYFEFFYRMHGADVGFDPNDPATPDTAPRVRTKNLGNLLALDTVDFGQCPTQWQKSLYPKRYHPILHVVHEGVDTTLITPDPKARLRLASANLELAAGDEVVTYVARNLEPYRGFPSFMRSLPEILRRRPKAQVLIVGGDGVSYGSHLPDGKTFRQEMLRELAGSIDLSRVQFLGKVPYEAFLMILRVSRVHVYLTYPFVLSWSMLEAMAAGCLIVGSRTQPVQEVIRDGENGLLVDIFSPSDIAARVVEALEAPHAHDSLRSAARQTVVEHYDLKTKCLPVHLDILNSLAGQYRAVVTSPRGRNASASVIQEGATLQ